MTTFRSKLLAGLLALFILCTGAGAFAQTAPAAQAGKAKYSAEKIALAKRYIASMPIETDIKNAIDMLANRVAPEDRVLFRKLGDSALDYDRLRAAAELAVLDVFTESELEAMVAFYETPEGQSVRTKMQAYDKRMAPVMTEIMTDFVKKLQENNIVPRQ